mgnify:CR=1 FL=1
MKAIQLNATKREKSGKGASRAVRRSGFVPAVVYGDKLAPEMISIEEKILVAEMGKKGIWTRQYEINVDGKDKHLVLCQDIQKHPVSNRPIHADFLRISKNSLLTLEVPVQFIGEGVAPGFKKGGVLNIVHRTLQIKCTPDRIPESFTLDMSKAEIGDTFNASDIQLPEGVSLTAKEDFTIASVVTPQEEVKDQVQTVAAAPAEGTAAAAAAPAAAAPAATEEKK